MTEQHDTGTDPVGVESADPARAPAEEPTAQVKNGVGSSASADSHAGDSAPGTVRGEPTQHGGAHQGGHRGERGGSHRHADGGHGDDPPSVVIRDRRKIRPAGAGGDTEVTAASTPDTGAMTGDTTKEKPGQAGTAAADAVGTGTAEAESGLGPFGAELEALRAELDERTRDVQRVSAEYANYRKRVDRDRGLVVENATGNVLSALLPVLDDLDRAREHGDLVGPFGSVAEQLIAAMTKFGLTPFGEKGDPFDPTRHEAVAHQTSGDVTEPTCVEILRRGYLLGDRLLRAALVAVADPE